MNVAVSPSKHAAPMPVNQAIDFADDSYNNAKASLTSPLELPWAIHASNAVRDLNGAVAALQPHASGADFGARALKSSVDHAMTAVGLIERAKGGDQAVTIDQMLGSINSAQAALFQE
jgi:hypothetical protein